MMGFAEALTGASAALAAGRASPAARLALAVRNSRRSRIRIFGSPWSLFSPRGQRENAEVLEANPMLGILGACVAGEGDLQLPLVGCRDVVRERRQEVSLGI